MFLLKLLKFIQIFQFILLLFHLFFDFKLEFSHFMVLRDKNIFLFNPWIKIRSYSGTSANIEGAQIFIWGANGANFVKKMNFK